MTQKEVSKNLLIFVPQVAKKNSLIIYAPRMIFFGGVSTQKKSPQIDVER